MTENSRAADDGGRPEPLVRNGAERLLVVGLGNPWAGDDGVGCHVVRRLGELAAVELPNGGAKRMPLRAPTEVEFLELQHAGPELLDAMADRDVLIVIDAVVSGPHPAPPGTIHRLTWQPGMLAARGVERASSHGFGLQEVLELAAHLNRLPRQVVVWGVEAASVRVGSPLSPAVAMAAEDVVAAIRQEIDHACERSGSSQRARDADVSGCDHRTGSDAVK